MTRLREYLSVPAPWSLRGLEADPLFRWLPEHPQYSELVAAAE